MSDINNVSLTGRLTRDPELRVTAGGIPASGYGLAHLLLTSRSVKIRDPLSVPCDRCDRGGLIFHDWLNQAIHIDAPTNIR